MPSAKPPAPASTAPIASAPIRSWKASPSAPAPARMPPRPPPLNQFHPPSTKTELDITDIRNSLRHIMWRNVGIERTADRLDETREIIAFWSRYVMDKIFDPAALGPSATAGWELQNMLTVCSLITSAAYTRTESRGVPTRLDYPARDDNHWRLHLLWCRPAETPIPEPILP